MRTEEVLQRLPHKLKQMIGSAVLLQNTVGCSKALVFHLPELKAYLKTAPFRDVEPLAYEAEVLHWLQGKLPVPAVLYFEHHGDYEYLLMSEVEGEDCSRELYRQDPEGMVRKLAEGLKLIHSVGIVDCTLDQGVEVKLKKARSNLERGLIRVADREPRYQGTPLPELYAQLLAKKPTEHDLVFTHGDYCLPNIILTDGQLSGFIDLGRAGVCDRYVDLALAIRSLEHNGYASPELVHLFFEVYGLSDIDQAKMEFYTLLDEFL